LRCGSLRAPGTKVSSAKTAGDLTKGRMCGADSKSQLRVIHVGSGLSAFGGIADINS
jgi:hypothetical protein